MNYAKTRYPFYIQIHKPELKFVFFLCRVLIQSLKPQNGKLHPGACLIFWIFKFVVLIVVFIIDLLVMICAGWFYLLFIKAVVFFKWFGRKTDKAIDNTINAVFKRVVEPILFIGTLTIIVIVFIAGFKSGLFKQVYLFIANLM